MNTVNPTNISNGVFTPGEESLAELSDLPVCAGSLQTPPVRPGQQESRPASMRSFEKPSPAKPVTLRAAEGALDRILRTFGQASNGKPITLAELERTPMEAMGLAASLLGVKALGDNANLKSLALEIQSRGAQNMRLRQNEDLRQQIDKAIEDAHKAHKGGIFSALVDWVVSVAEVVSGVAKIVIGDYAGGAMDLAAGCAGLVKAICETAALIDTANAERYMEVAEIAGKIQLAFEIAGMFVDAVSVGRGVMAAKSITRATSSVLASGSGDALHAAIKIGGKTGENAAEHVAAAIGKAVAEDAAEQVVKALCESATANVKNLVQRAFSQGQLIKAFSQQGIEQLVSRAVERAAKEAAKSGAETTVQALTRQVIKEVQHEIVKTAVKACLQSSANTGKAIVKAVVVGANDIAQGVIHLERAELQKIIQQLMAESSFMQFMLDEFEKIKKRSAEDIHSLLDGAGKALAAGSENLKNTGALLSNIAASTV